MRQLIPGRSDLNVLSCIAHLKVRWGGAQCGASVLSGFRSRSAPRSPSMAAILAPPETSTPSFPASSIDRRSLRPKASRAGTDGYGIKTIVNLRGAHPKSDWYRNERGAAQALGIRLIDYRMSSERDLSARDVEELLSILSKAEAPILIHCQNGADRSGLVSALYVAGVAGGSEFFAEFQLTPIYGHLPIPGLAAFAMDRSFEMAEPLLGFPAS